MKTDQSPSPGIRIASAGMQIQSQGVQPCQLQWELIIFDVSFCFLPRQMSSKPSSHLAFQAQLPGVTAKMLETIPIQPQWFECSK